MLEPTLLCYEQFGSDILSDGEGKHVFDDKRRRNKKM